MKDVSQQVRETAAAWINDNLSMDRQQVNGMPLDHSQVAILTNPGYWDVRDKGETYGGVRAYTTTCRLMAKKITFTLEVCNLLPEALFFVQAASVENEAANAKYTFSIHETQNSVREKDRVRKVTGCDAVVEWYLSRYNPEADHDMGTEPCDWERIDSWRPEVLNVAVKSKWLRIPNRTDDTYTGTFLEPGIVEMTTYPDGTKTFIWSKKPVGVFAMEVDELFTNQLDKSGIGGWA